MRVNRSVAPVFLALLCALIGCRAADTDRAVSEDTATSTGGDVVADSGQQLPPASQAWVDSIRAAEQPMLRQAGDAAERSSWDRLVLTARSGNRQTFNDEVTDGELRRLHVYDGYIAPLEQHLVEVIYVPEGGEFILVNARTGERLQVDAPPLPSPDSSRFITASLDLVAGHRPNRIRIYRISAGRPVLEWEATPHDWGADAPQWLDSSAIRLDRTVVDTTTTPFTIHSSPMRLERDGGEWRIVPQ